MRLSAAFVFILVTSPAYAEQRLSLQDALKTSASGNLSLKAAERELAVLEGRAIQGGAIPNPELGGEISALPFGKSENSEGPVQKELEVAQQVELWGKRGLRRESVRAELDSARARYEALGLDVTREVKESYWRLSLAAHKVLFAEEVVRFQQRFLARTQDRFRSGQARAADLARARLEAARAASDLLVAKREQQGAQAVLSRLMGLDVRKDLAEPEHLQESVIELDESKLMEKAVAARPERRAIAALRTGAVADRALAQRLLWGPDLRAGLLYQTGQRGDGRNSWGARLGLAVPLWYRYGGERRAAAARLASLDTQSKDADQAIFLEVHQAYLDLNLAGEQIKLWKQAVDQATEAARLAEQRYLEGNVDLLVFFQARRELVAATLDYLESMRAYQAALAALERAVGTELTQR